MRSIGTREISPCFGERFGEESYQIYRTHVNNTGRCYAIVSRYYAIAGQYYAIASRYYAIAGRCYAIVSRYINNAADALTLQVDALAMQAENSLCTHNKEGVRVRFYAGTTNFSLPASPKAA